MNKEQLETNMAALKLLQSATNDKVRSYEQQIADLTAVQSQVAYSKSAKQILDDFALSNYYIPTEG